ncbi:MAG: 30S ribosomal protein S12 methylthiotransferase RimO [Ignavibacteriae bacterium]|nr:30S ribosomal protein S12 methylthiotransferase RimO [Ignavibacteriota bacterium]
MSKKEKVHVLTLGCEKNTVDSEVLMNQLRLNEMELTNDPNRADTLIINTCGFIQDAKNESIETILQAVERKKHGKLQKVVVMGCLSERYSIELQKEIPEVDLFIGANKMDKVVQALGGDYKYELLGERILTTPKHFAYLKISEGCDRPCAFCAIPLMRGKHQSKSIEKLISEAENLASNGVKELILIAQESTYYGLDLYGKRTLPQLLEQLNGVTGLEWIRLMYAYPSQFPLEILDAFIANEKICRYLDMPVQHISDSVLKSMQRGISSRATRNLIETIRAKVPNIALRTTIIVGYPNETENDFNELVEFIKETEFARLGVFTYSQEEDTSAFPLGDPIPFEVKEERKRIIMETQKEISLRKNEELTGKQLRVLVDEKQGDVSICRTERDAPEVDNSVMVHSSNEFAIGNFYEVEIIDAEEYDLFAIPVGKEVRGEETNVLQNSLREEKVFWV